MAPSSRPTTPRASTTPNAATHAHNSTTDNNPTWDFSNSTLPDFLNALEENDLLFSEVTGLHSLFTRGYVTERNTLVVESEAHILDIMTSTQEYTFRAPAPVGKHTGPRETALDGASNGLET